MKKSIFILFLSLFIFLSKGALEQDEKDSYQKVDWNYFDEDKFVPLRERKVSGYYGKIFLKDCVSSNDLATETFFEFKNNDIEFSAKQGSNAISLTLLEEGVDAPLSLQISDPRWNNIQGVSVNSELESLMITTQQDYYFKSFVTTVFKKFIFNPYVLLLAEKENWKEGVEEPVIYYASKNK